MSGLSHRLTLLHTNDIHSHFEEMPKIASLIRRLRAGLDERYVCTIDCGDHMDRMRGETEGTEGLANIVVMNETGYEIAVPGNNEGLTFPRDTISQAYAQHADFAVVCGNLLEIETGAPPEWLSPFRIVRKGDMKVGFIGLTACFPDFYGLLGWDVRDPFETAGNLVGQLRPQVDVLVVLSHLGYSADERLASEIDGIDVILGAHTHHLLEVPVRIGNTHICAAGKFGQYVGEVTIGWDAAGSKVLGVEGCCHPVAGEHADPRIVKVIEEYRELGEKKLDRVVATLREPVEIAWDRESGLGNLLAAGVRRWTEAEIGLINSGQLLGSLRAGNITRGMLLRLCPSPINPCRMQLEGKHIARALEESLLPEFQHKGFRGFGFRGSQLGMLCVDGVTVRYSREAEPYRKITGIFVNGEPIEEERLYTVGTLDMFTFGVGYLPLREGKAISYFLPEFIRDILERQLNDAEALSRSLERHWQAE